ncbi:MAG: hypothetical protein H6592_04755 [Flavobacteriales bacterium]|nr:hypothetical protein [Flavobacteriales bacterium]
MAGTSTLTLEDIITVLPTPDAAFRVTPEVAVLGAPHDLRPFGSVWLAMRFVVVR